MHHFSHVWDGIEYWKLAFDITRIDPIKGFGRVFSLAGVMRLMTALFPERSPSVDPTMVAAITSTVAMVYPGARVTSIEEEA